MVAAHPGYAATELQKNTARATGSGLERFLYALGGAILAQSAEQGAWPQLRAAVDSGVSGGRMYGPHRLGQVGHPIQVRLPNAANDADARRLWEVSESLTGVSVSPA